MNRKNKRNDKPRRQMTSIIMVFAMVFGVLVIVNISENVSAQTGWTKYAGNPVLNISLPGEWDETSVAGPAVIKDGSIYEMWYSGYNNTTVNKIGYANSSDGTTWVKYAGNPALDSGLPGSWDEAGVFGATVIKDSGLYRMWYTGYDNTTYSIGYANSTDGLVWNKYALNPVLNLGPPGSWDDTLIVYPTVIKVGSEYKMWYSSWNIISGAYEIGYANSSDGIAWVKYSGNPVMTPSPDPWESSYIYGGSNSVIFDGMTYHFWYSGSDGTNFRIGYATSLDGINWTKYLGNPVLDLGLPGEWDDDQVGLSTVIYDGIYKMWYTGSDGTNNRIGYAYELAFGPDAYEDDDVYTNASLIPTDGTIQSHNFHDSGDEDWVMFSITPGTNYTIETLDLGPSCNTYIYLYESDGTTLITEDDDGGGGLASRIEWNSTGYPPGNYYVRVVELGGGFGSEYTYDIRIFEGISAEFSPPHSDYGLDTDLPLDGFYNYLVVNVTVNVTTAGWYEVDGDLYDGPGMTWIDGTSNNTYLNAGIQTVQLYFDGLDIYLSGIDGPYLVELDLYDDMWNWLDSDSCTTSFYLYTEFEAPTPDAYEDDDVYTNASLIPTDGTIQSHNFHDAGDEDWVNFSIIPGTTYTIVTLNLGPSCDTYIYLYESDGTTLITSDDDGGGGLASQIVWNSTGYPPGDYYVRVVELGGGFGGGYTYDIYVQESSFIPDIYEIDDTYSNASLIPTNGTIQSHNFHDAGDEDWVNFSIIPGSTYTIETLNLGPSCDTVIYLYESDGTTLITSDDDEGGGLASRIVWDSSGYPPGDYYVRVVEYGDNFGSGYTYDIRILEGTPAEFSPPHSDYGLDTDIDGDYDFLVVNVSVNVTTPGWYTVEGELWDGSGVIWIDDASNYLYLDAGIQTVDLHFDGILIWDSGIVGPYLVTLDLYDDGWNFLGSDNHTTALYIPGDFDAPTPDAYEPDNNPGEASPIPTNGTNQSHNFHVPSDEDWVNFSIIPGTTYTIETLNLGPSCDTYIYLYESDGTTLITSDDDGGGGLASRIVWDSTGYPPGNYYVRVVEYGGGFGSGYTYDIRVLEGTPAEFSPPHSDYGLDTDIDGDYDFLVVNVSVNVTTPGWYTVEGDLWDGPGMTWIDGTSNYMYLDAGIQTVQLYFDGLDIHLSGIDGPYLVYLDLYDDMWNWLDSDSCTTSFYLYTEFEAPTPDAFEDDDTYSNASLILTDGTIQSHNFHDAGDEDWVMFSITLYNPEITFSRKIRKSIPHT